jgi:hypothetical protein
LSAFWQRLASSHCRLIAKTSPESIADSSCSWHVAKRFCRSKKRLNGWSTSRIVASLEGLNDKKHSMKFEYDDVDRGFDLIS